MKIKNGILIFSVILMVCSLCGCKNDCIVEGKKKGLDFVFFYKTQEERIEQSGKTIELIGAVSKVGGQETIDNSFEVESYIEIATDKENGVYFVETTGQKIAQELKKGDRVRVKGRISFLSKDRCTVANHYPDDQKISIEIVE